MQWLVHLLLAFSLTALTACASKGQLADDIGAVALFKLGDLSKQEPDLFVDWFDLTNKNRSDGIVMLISSTSDKSILDSQIAQKLHGDAASIVLEQLQWQYGGMRTLRHEFAVYDLSFINEFSIFNRYQGIIGEDILSQYVLDIDVQAKELRVFQRIGTLAKAMDLSSFELVPLAADYSFSMQSAGVEITAMKIATGSEVSSLTAKYIHQGQLLDEKNCLVSVNSTNCSQLVLFNNLSLGNIDLSKQIFAQDEIGYLGLDFLANHHVIIDYPNHQMYIKAY